MSVQSRPPSESREEEALFPLSARTPPPATEDPLGDRALPERTDPVDETFECAAPATADGVFLLGNARRYHPPVYVRAINWYSGGGGGAAAVAACAVTEVVLVVLGSMGAWIQPTVHFSSSARSGFASRAAACCVRDMCADCVGMRNCAYDHSDSKYLGIGMNDVNEDSLDCRFLKKQRIALGRERDTVRACEKRRKELDYHSRGPGTPCDQRENVDGALVAPHAYLRFVRPESDAVNLRLI